MAKSISPNEGVLAGLRIAMDALPAVKPLTGKGGVFPAGAKGKQLADLAISQGVLIAREETVRVGKRSKKVVQGVITEMGIRYVVDADSPKSALQALLPAVQAVVGRPNPPDPETFRAELARATESCVEAIKVAFGKLEGEVFKALSPPPVTAVDPGVVLHALQHALERVDHPIIPNAPPAPHVDRSAPTSHADLALSLEEAITTFVVGWAKEKTVGCQFDVLWDHLKGLFPNLTIGAFQDALRKLYQAGRIRLGGWPRMLDDLPQPQLALFISTKVMYYAQPAPSPG